MHPLTAYFTAQGITGSELQQVTDAFTYKQLLKGEYFAKEGNTCRYLAFVTKGWFQYYYLKDGKELTTYVTGRNNFVVSLFSFFKQQPGKEYIRALEDAELWQVHYNALAQLKTTNQGFRTFYINALEGLSVGMDETRSNFMTLTAEERYALLLQREPELLQHIPLQYLATILGVTARHLSRIRNSIR